MDALTFFRISNWLYKKVPVLPKLLQLLILFLYNCYIPYNTTIGKGCRIGHRGIGVVINKEPVLGKNVLIRARVTIGKKEPDMNIMGSPLIDNENLYAAYMGKMIPDLYINEIRSYTN